MSALLNHVRAKGQAYDETVDLQSKAAGAVRDQEARLKDLRGRVTSIRKSLVEQRVAAATGSQPTTKLADSELASSELDVEAAEAVLEQLVKRAAHAQAQVEPAEKAWAKTVCAYARELEAGARLEVEHALQALSAACAKGIAAAAVSKEYGEVMGYVSFNYPCAAYGPSGRLEDILTNVRREDWPAEIQRFGFSRDRVDRGPVAHPGVAEEIARIKSSVKEVAR